jgi:hypothetical protein
MAAAVSVAVWSAQAGAQSASSEVEGNVVAIDAGELVIDLGSLRGASDGDLVELWRPLRIKHPVTGKTLIDRFRIGTLKLVQVRTNLALAAVEGTPSRPPAAGDVVVLRGAAARGPSSAPAAAARGPARKGPGAPPVSSGTPAVAPPDGGEHPARGDASLDAEEAELSELFDSLKGVDPAERIRRYEDLVRAHPKGRFAVVLYEEAQALRRLFSKSGAEARGPVDDNAPQVAEFHGPLEALAGVPLRFGIELKGNARGAVIHVRSADEVAYSSLPMTPAGPGYFTVVVAAEKMSSPTLAYFIEATTEDGSARPVVGAAQTPRVVSVNEVPRPQAPRRLDATASVWTDYALYNLKKHNDYVSQTEGYFGFRLADVGVRAVRSGFGVFRGKGGTLDDLDVLGKSPRSVGLTYGYLEGEYAFQPSFAMVGRAVIGLRDDGVGGGGQVFFRVGHDRRTNILFGGEFLGGIGIRGITELAWNTMPRVPILFRLEVTNPPAGVAASRPAVDPSPAGTSFGQGEVGARAIVQAGYRIVPPLVVALRGSFQGRNINHSGPGFGAAVTYEW